MGNPRPFPVYCNEVAGDAWCTYVDNRTFGAYWRLLLMLWTNGGLYCDLRLLARAAREDVRTFRRLWFGSRADAEGGFTLTPRGIGSRFIGKSSGVVGGEPGEELTNLKLERSALAQAKMLGRSAIDKPQQPRKSSRNPGHFLGRVPPPCSAYNPTTPKGVEHGRGEAGPVDNSETTDPGLLALEAMKRGLQR